MLIYLLGNKATCPHCGGTIHRTAGSEDYTCINCHRVFEVTGTGRSDNELEVREFMVRGKDARHNGN